MLLIWLLTAFQAACKQHFEPKIHKYFICVSSHKYVFYYYIYYYLVSIECFKRQYFNCSVSMLVQLVYSEVIL